ncbi:MAG TPA: AAA family ATPase [Kofleriaceae bacterium]|nr:AAA family ATPase [Kofleriaceae bacterium]
MLHHLHLKNVGPAPEMRLDLGRRLNLITGDNGLGKSFLLDVAWWAMTRRWPHELNRRMTSGYTARPTDPTRPASIDFELTSKSGIVSYQSEYSPRDEAWTGKPGRPWNPELVIYAHADGAFSVWDPARNYWKRRGNVDVQERLPGYVFTPSEVWDELKVDVDGRTTIVCNGLVRDWASWIREGGPLSRLMKNILSELSPDSGPEERLKPGPLVRISLEDSRDIPSLETAYGTCVPILHASAGVRRVVALAYMLLWSWSEHVFAARRHGEQLTSQVVMLIDELEAHLHPRWQRSILHPVLGLAKLLHKQATIQLIAATHSPLVLASAEPDFDPEQDAWFDLDLERVKRRPQVVLRKREFVRRGDASAWLTSEAFDLKEARSIPAERAISRALDLTASANPSAKAVQKVDDQLRAALGDTDRFWLRWSQFRDALRNKRPARATRRRAS